VPVHTFGSGVDLGVTDRAVAAGTPVRLRLLNTDSTPHRFALNGTAFRVVAVDGSDLVGPGEVSGAALRLAAGGRYDVAFDMPPDGVALAVGGAVLRLGTPSFPVDQGGDWPEWDPFAYGVPAPMPSGPVDRSYTLVLDRGLVFPFQYAQTVNGKAFPDIPALPVRTGELVELTVVNRSTETHPWHLHGHRILVVSRDGQAPTGTPLLMDSFDVRPGEVWRVVFRADNPGLWMNHCHNLAHADKGMALHVAYEGVTTPLSGAHGG
jgi:FtsP/CotA-like multicopper oxidase with cupredoxin domain